MHYISEPDRPALIRTMRIAIIERVLGDEVLDRIQVAQVNPNQLTNAGRKLPITIQQAHGLDQAMQRLQLSET